MARERRKLNGRRKHIFSDLEAYQCTFVDCPTGDATFYSKKEWKAHEEQHSYVFRCGNDSHGDFVDQAIFIAHLTTLHGINLPTDCPPATLAFFRRSRAGVNKAECRLCHQQSRSILAHMSAHLERLALFALPGSMTADSEMSDSADSNAGADLEKADDGRLLLIGAEEVIDEGRADTETEKTSEEGKEAEDGTESAPANATVKEWRDHQLEAAKAAAAVAKASAEVLAAARAVDGYGEQQSQTRLEAEAKLQAAQEAFAKVRAPVRFKDAIGRNYNFPFERCYQWRVSFLVSGNPQLELIDRQDMEALINQAFKHIETLEDWVYRGHYDLLGPDGEIIMPEYWRETIQPGMQITMMMWPMPDLKQETKGESVSLSDADLDDILNPKVAEPKERQEEETTQQATRFGRWKLGGRPKKDQRR